MTILGKTKFIYQDGNTYFFKLYQPNSSSEYFRIKVYYRITFFKIPFYFEMDDYQIIDKYKELNIEELNSKISSIIEKHKKEKCKKTINDIVGWDGYIGNEECKKKLIRDNKLTKILK